MIRQLSPYLPYYPYLLAGMFGLSVVLLLLAWYNLHRRRTADVWRVRHDSGIRGSRLLMVSLAMLFITVTISAFSAVVIVSLGYVDEFFPPRSPYDVRGVAVSSLASPTPILRGANRTVLPPSAAPTLPRPTLTVTPRPTQVPSPVPTVEPLARLGITLPQARQTAPPGATLELVGASADPAAAPPVTLPTHFDAGISQLYLAVKFQGMVNGVQWSRVLYRDAEPIQGGAHLWSAGQAGTSHFLFEESQGYPSGAYEVRLFLDEREVSVYTFQVR